MRTRRLELGWQKKVALFISSVYMKNATYVDIPLTNAASVSVPNPTFLPMCANRY